MRRVEQIISRIRRETENEGFGDSFGISDNEMVDYLNDAQDRVHAEAVKKYPKFFLAEEVLTSPINQEAVDLPARIFLGHIQLLEYSSTGNTGDYYRLKQAEFPERFGEAVGHPEYYIRKNNEILLVPTPGSSSGFLRVTYVKKLARLDKRRAQILTVSTSGNSITSLTLDTSVELDRDAILDEYFASVAEKTGAQKMAAIPIEDINESTGVVTLGSGFEFEEGETISVGDYLVAGEFSTNKSTLHDFTERYLSSHLRMEILDRDSNSSGTANQNEKMTQMLAEIIESYDDENSDIHEPTVLDSQYIIDDNW